MSIDLYIYIFAIFIFLSTLCEQNRAEWRLAFIRRTETRLQLNANVAKNQLMQVLSQWFLTLFLLGILVLLIFHLSLPDPQDDELYQVNTEHGSPGAELGTTVLVFSFISL